MSGADHSARRKAALAALPEGAEALLVSTVTNVRYLTGFTGSSAQLLLCDDAVFFTDGRYTEQSAAEVADVERRIYGNAGMPAAVLEALRERGITRLGLEASNVTLAGHRRLQDKLEGIELVETTDLIEGGRVRKDASEIAAIRAAQRIAERALTSTLAAFEGGTELELALALEWTVRTQGAEGVSFEVIVAADAHAALPHAAPRDVRIPDRGVVLIDMGARAAGYCSDMTRTYLRDAPDPMPAVHDAVVRSLEAAVAAIRPGATGREVDAAAREVLDAAGYGDAFVHSTGHGVGLEIHEEPRLAHTVDEPLEEGMVVTVEPGVYLPGLGGVRVEDLVVVTADGCDNLTSLPHGPEWPTKA